MPFFIPIMIAATVASMIPSFIPPERKRAQEVIDQTGTNYYRRQTWRTGNPRGTSQNPYPKIETDPQNAKSGINFMQYLPLLAIGAGALIFIKVIR